MMRFRVQVSEYRPGTGLYYPVSGMAMRFTVADGNDLKDVWEAAQRAIVRAIAKKRAAENQRDLTGG